MAAATRVPALNEAARPPGAPADRFPRLALPAVLLGALLLRLHHLGERSLWTDEGSTWTAATASFPDLIRRCIDRDASPPLYYLLTSLALRFGDAEAQLRAVSLLASVVMVWLTYRIARLFAGRAEATMAALLMAVSPYQLMYAQEARTYTLVACLMTASLFLFARAVMLERPRAWPWFVVVSALALYTQSIALLGVGVQAVVVVATTAGRRHLRSWLLAQLVVIALYAPWLVLSLAQATHLSDSHWYLTRPDDRGVFQVLRSLLLSPISVVTAPAGARLPGLDAWLPRAPAQILLAVIALGPLLLGARDATASGRRGTIVRLATLSAVLPLLAVLAASVRVPLWLPRYFVFLSPPLAILLARGVFSLRPRPLALGWGAALVLVDLYACRRYDLDYTKEPWRDVAAHIAAVSPPGRTAVLVPFDVDPYAFYNRGSGGRIAAFEVSHPDVPFASRFTPRQLDEVEATALARAAGFDDVWVVVRSPNSEVRRELARRTQRAAARDRTPVGGEEIWNSTAGPLRVTHFRRTR